MDLIITNPTKTETPRTENESQPKPIINSLSFTKNHPQPPVVTYKECLKNHAASLGGHALDGCGEFMPSPTASDPTSLKCAACGCHRNFHRHEPNNHQSTTTTHFLQFHNLPPPLSRNSLSPPPISTSHVLLPLRPAVPNNQPPMTHHPRAQKYSRGQKRHRTKFSEEQKEKMLGLAEKVDWKMKRCDDEIVDNFCNEVGIGKSVLKVWMHNNKSTLRKSNGTSGRVYFDNNNGHNNNNNSRSHHAQNDSGADFHVSNNGSSSSS